jgi:hypothetical protein
MRTQLLRRRVWPPDHVHVLVLAAAITLLASTLLPWRDTGRGHTSGWKTAELALGLARTGGDTRLLVAALACFAVPVAAVAVIAALLVRPGNRPSLRRTLALTAGAAVVLAVGAVSADPTSAVASGEHLAILSAAVLTAASFLPLDR